MASNVTLIGLGDEQLTVSNTSVALASIPDGAHRAMIRVTDDAIFVANDATDAASGSGLEVAADSFIDLTDARYDLASFRFIRKTGDAVLDILYYN